MLRFSARVARMSHLRSVGSSLARGRASRRGARSSPRAFAPSHPHPAARHARGDRYPADDTGRHARRDRLRDVPWSRPSTLDRLAGGRTDLPRRSRTPARRTALRGLPRAGRPHSPATRRRRGDRIPGRDAPLRPVPWPAAPRLPARSPRRHARILGPVAGSARAQQLHRLPWRASARLPEGDSGSPAARSLPRPQLRTWRLA